MSSYGDKLFINCVEATNSDPNFLEIMKEFNIQFNLRITGSFIQGDYGSIEWEGSYPY